MRLLLCKVPTCDCYSARYVHVSVIMQGTYMCLLLCKVGTRDCCYAKNSPRLPLHICIFGFWQVDKIPKLRLTADERFIYKPSSEHFCDTSVWGLYQA